MTGSSAIDLSVHVSASDAEARELLNDAWDELVRAQVRPNPTLLSGWLAAMLMRDQGLFTVVRVEHERRLVAAAALSMYRPLGPAGPTFARWPGDPTMWFDPDILIRPDNHEAGGTLVRAIVQRTHALYVPCFADSALSRTLRGWDTRALHRWPPADGWVAPIPLPRDAYMRRRIGQDMRQAQRKGAQTEVRIATSRSDIDVALERMFALHHAYWETRPDYIRRFSATEELRALNRRAVLALADSTESFVAEVVENGEVVAARIGLLAGHGLVAHTSATRRHTILKEPGYACLLAQIDHGASRGATVVDLGPGAGGPGTVKGRAGAIHVPIDRVMCARSPGLLRACLSLVRTRDRSQEVLRRLRRARA